MKVHTYLWILERRGSRELILGGLGDRPQELEPIS